MSYKWREKLDMSAQQENKSRESVKSILQYPIAYIDERGVRKEICELFNVRMALSEEDGKTPVAIYFPYYDQKDVLVGWKRRDLTIDKDTRGHFTTIGKQGTHCKLFGQQIADKIDRKHTTLIYTEGEWDVLSAYQSLVDSVVGTKYEGMQPFVVGLPCGTGNAVDATMTNIEFISSFDKIILSFDNDEATPKQVRDGIKKGKEATEDVACVLMMDNIFVAQFPSEVKDVNDMVREGRSDELAKLLQFCKNKFVAEKIYNSSDISFEELIEPRVEGVYVNDFPKLMGKIHGFRKRELVVVTAPSGVGKSYITAAISHGLAKAGQRVGMIYLEETRKETKQRMVARYLEINYSDFKDNPQKYASIERLREADDWCNDNNKFVFLGHFGSIQIEDLMNKLKALVYMSKVDFIILDHLSMTISGLKESDERKLLDMTMTELAAFCASTDVGIIAVSHLNRSVAQEFRPPKGKEDEPFWVDVNKEAMRGSAALEQLSWIVIGIEPEIMPDKSRGRARLTVLKNRPWSVLGIADVLKMDQKTGLLLDASFEKDF